MPKNGLEVFRELKIQSDSSRNETVRDILLSGSYVDWKHSSVREEQLTKYASSGVEGVICFDYTGKELPQAGLTLWQNGSVYNVSNIVPTEIRELGISLYNKLLCNFFKQVIVNKDGLIASLSDDIQTMENWISIEAAKALNSFSLLANKSTTNSHPSDRRRWEQFVILTYQSEQELSADILMRWLSEVDGWDETSAQKLAIEYESGISLIESFDSFSSG